MSDKPASALPEKFEVFEENMRAAEKAKAPAKRHRKAPEVKAEEPARVVKPMGGMEKTTWSGIPMWVCPRCRSTTFNELDATNHTCKSLKYAHEVEE